MPTQDPTQEDERTVWAAVGVLMAAPDHPEHTAAHRAIDGRAQHLGVPPADIAAYVLWRGQLPT